jgi:hypothetical protein
MNLYQITQEAQYLAALLETEELTPELEAELLINQEQLQSKGINYAKIITNYTSQKNQICEQINRLKEMEDSCDKKINWLTESLKKAMLVSGIEKIESPLFKISIRRSEAVEVEIPEALPVDWQVKKITITADKVAIKKAIKEGYSITGARLVENFNLSIK